MVYDIRFQTFIGVFRLMLDFLCAEDKDRRERQSGFFNPSQGWRDTWTMDVSPMASMGVFIGYRKSSFQNVTILFNTFYREFLFCYAVVYISVICGLSEHKFGHFTFSLVRVDEFLILN